MVFTRRISNNNGRSHLEIYFSLHLGILFQESHLNDHHGDTYLMSAYVEYVQAAGALAVPIRWVLNVSYLILSQMHEEVMDAINWWKQGNS